MCVCFTPHDYTFGAVSIKFTKENKPYCVGFFSAGKKNISFFTGNKICLQILELKYITEKFI